MTSSFFSSLTGWVYQPNKKKCSPPPGSAAFSSTSQSTITTNPAGTLPFSSPTYSFVNSNVKSSIGRPVCEFSAVNYFKNSEFTCSSKSFVFTRACSDRGRENGFKLKKSNFRLDIGEELCCEDSEALAHVAKRSCDYSPTFPFYLRC